MDFATWYEVEVEPLPNWSDRPREEYRQYVTDLVRDIEEQAFLRRRKEQEALGRQGQGRRPKKNSAPTLKPRVPGPTKISAADPHHRPEHLESSSAPAFHAATKKARRALWDAYAWFVAAYRIAAEKLKGGDRNVVFPAGCFPSALPFEPG